jgi:hypothetical protein
MLIWLASYPRSGNTMVRMLLDRIYGVPSSSIYDESSPETPGPLPETPLWVSSRSNTSPPTAPVGVSALQFVKTHALPADNAPAICIVRDGRDVLVSYAHFLRSFNAGMAERSFEEVLQELIITRELHRNWSLHLTAWRARTRSKASAWIHYESLVRNPLETIEAGLSQFGITLKPTGGSLPDFAELHRVWPAFFRKGTSGAWRAEMPDELHRLFWQHHGVMMEEFGYVEDRPANFDGQAARMALIESLFTTLQESDADRLARLQVIHKLDAALKESGADRRALAQVNQALEAALQECEANGQAQLRVNRKLEAAVEQLRRDRAPRKHLPSLFLRLLSYIKI